MLHPQCQPLSRWFIALVLLLSMNFLSNAQDIHYSQFYNSPINTNPALTGIFNGDIRFIGNYRSQWFKDNLGEYTTFSATADRKFYPKDRSSQRFFSGGIQFNYDVAGDGNLSLGHLGIAGSYTIPVLPNNFLSLGGLLGVSQRRFEMDDLLWDNQWNGISVDPTRPTGENFTNTSKVFLDLSAGLNWRWQKSPRTKFDIGAGAFHLNRPNQSFLETTDEELLPIRVSAHAISSFRLTRDFDLLLNGNMQWQGPYEQIVAGGAVKVHLNHNRGKELALALGAAYRVGDAIIPQIAVNYTQWYGSFSYDINISDFEVATARRGGPEFTLIYIIAKVQPLGTFKACPLY